MRSFQVVAVIIAPNEGRHAARHFAVELPAQMHDFLVPVEMSRVGVGCWALVALISLLFRVGQHVSVE